MSFPIVSRAKRPWLEVKTPKILDSFAKVEFEQQTRDEWLRRVTVDLIQNLFRRALDWKSCAKWSGLLDQQERKRAMEMIATLNEESAIVRAKYLFLGSKEKKKPNEIFEPLCLNDLYILFNIVQVSRKWFYSCLNFDHDEATNLATLQLVLLCLMDEIYWSTMEFRHVRRTVTGPSLTKAWSSVMKYPHVSSIGLSSRPGILGVSLTSTELERYIDHRWEQKLWPERDEFKAKLIRLFKRKLDVEFEQRHMDEFADFALEYLTKSNIAVGLVIVHAMASKYGRPVTVSRLFERMLKSKEDQADQYRLLLHILFAETIAGMYNLASISDCPSFSDPNLETYYPLITQKQECDPLFLLAFMSLNF